MIGVAAILTLLVACSGTTKRSDIVGAWVHRQDTSIAEIDFAEDGSFIGSGIPRVVFDPFAEASTVDWKDTVELHGNWTVKPNGSVGFNIEGTGDVRGFDTFLSVRFSQGGVVLVRTIGNPDSGDTFAFSRK